MTQIQMFPSRCAAACSLRSNGEDKPSWLVGCKLKALAGAALLGTCSAISLALPFKAIKGRPALTHPDRAGGDAPGTEVMRLLSHMRRRSFTRRPSSLGRAVRRLLLTSSSRSVVRLATAARTWHKLSHRPQSASSSPAISIHDGSLQSAHTEQTQDPWLSSSADHEPAHARKPLS